MEGVNFQDFIFRFFYKMVRYMVPAYILLFCTIFGLSFLYPPALILSLTLLGLIISTIWFSKEVIEFTHAFYVSGHWKKNVRDYLKPRTLPDETIPNFKRLKRLTWFFMSFAFIFCCIALLCVLIASQERDWNLLRFMVYSSMVLFILFIHLFIGYWTLRGAKFVRKYKPF